MQGNWLSLSISPQSAILAVSPAPICTYIYAASSSSSHISKGVVFWGSEHRFQYTYDAVEFRDKESKTRLLGLICRNLDHLFRHPYLFIYFFINFSVIIDAQKILN